MTQAFSHEPSNPDDIKRRNRRLWFGLLNGPIVYAVYFLIGYFFAEAACKADLMRFTIFGLEAISFTVIAWTVVAALITASGLIISYRYWRSSPNDSDESSSDLSYPPFMAFVGAWVSGIFTLVILVTGIPAFFVVLCDWI